ncbi:MAG: GNAT family N-acetyltransferase [Patescibacteria group bacterium]
MQSINRLTADDTPSISAVAQKIISETPYYTSEARAAECDKFSADNLRKILDDDKTIFLVAKHGDNVIGFCYGYFDCGTFWADWIGVLTEYRRSGTATSLMQELNTILKATNTHKIWCDSRCDNIESNNLLQKSGFEQAAHLKRHWYGQDYYLWEKFI